jgi:hypothetical protein
MKRLLLMFALSLCLTALAQQAISQRYREFNGKYYDTETSGEWKKFEAPEKYQDGFKVYSIQEGTNRLVFGEITSLAVPKVGKLTKSKFYTQKIAITNLPYIVSEGQIIHPLVYEKPIGTVTVLALDIPVYDFGHAYNPQAKARALTNSIAANIKTNKP